MYDFVITKNIEELDPIEGTPEQKQAFIEGGMLPIAGPVQTGNEQKATKRIGVQELFGHIPRQGSIMVVKSIADPTAGWTFVPSEIIDHTGIQFIIDGSNIQLPQGWYRYEARADITFNVINPLNVWEPLTLQASSDRRHQATINFDFSYWHTEQIALSGIIHNQSSNDLNFGMSLSGITNSLATGVTAQLFLTIQSI
jgi:hypothetical protein